jgi:hypothetical protein
VISDASLDDSDGCACEGEEGAQLSLGYISAVTRGERQTGDVEREGEIDGWVGKIFLPLAFAKEKKWCCNRLGPIAMSTSWPLPPPFGFSRCFNRRVQYA